jgi:cellulose synthase/poly-beta-1,6-N-acetylglucosamine synthase-like glycosyltransferase
MFDFAATLLHFNLWSADPVFWLLHAVSLFWVIQSFFALWKTRRARMLYANGAKQVVPDEGSGAHPRVALFIPAKGASPRFGEFIEFILGQDYENFHAIFVTESTSDPAHEFLTKRFEKPTRRPVRLIVSGKAEHSMQKVHNHLAAFRLLEPEDRIIAFADCDFSAGTDWLSLLVAPLHRGQCDLATAYRWFVPTTENLPNRIVSIIGASIEPWMGPSWRICLWGGSMLMTREAFDSLNIPKNFEHSFNDDVRITRLAREAGKRMRYVRAVAAISPIDFTWRSFFSFARRQYMHVLELRALWWMGLLTPLAYLISFGTCVVLLANGNGWMLVWILLGLVFNMLRTGTRLAYLDERFTNGEARTLTKAVCGSWWMDPIVNLVHFIVVVASVCGRQVVWAGIRYRLLPRHRAEVVSDSGK